MRVILLDCSVMLLVAHVPQWLRGPYRFPCGAIIAPSITNSMSVSSPLPSINVCRYVMDWFVPTLQDEHWLQDSSHRNFANMWATRTIHAVSSYTMNPAEPRPEPIASIELKPMGVSRRDGRTTGLATPERNALNCRPGSGPPA